MWSLIMGVLFFFSSRRRHTRLQGDWSSDVCSSDLQTTVVPAQPKTFASEGETPAQTRSVTHIHAGRPSFGTLHVDVLASASSRTAFMDASASGRTLDAWQPLRMSRIRAAGT